jgi:hypothetical protein
MLVKLARGTVLVLLVAMIVVWAVSMANSSAAEPKQDTHVYRIWA